MMRLYAEMEKRMEVSPLSNFAAGQIASLDFIEISGDCESQRLLYPLRFIVPYMNTLYMNRLSL